MAYHSPINNGLTYEQTYLAEWSSGGTYFVGSQVRYQNHYFKALSAGTNHTPVVGTSTAYWADYGISSFTNIPTSKCQLWTASTTYNANARVVYGSAIYLSIAGGNTNHLPTDTGYWTPTWEPLEVAGVSLYTPGNTYSLGQRCVGDDLYSTPDAGMPTVWESLVNSNVGVTPYSDPSKWLNIGAPESGKMYNHVIGEQSANPGVIEVGIVCPIITVVNSLVLLNIEAQSVTVEVHSFYSTGGGYWAMNLIYSVTKSGLAGVKDLAFLDLPCSTYVFLKVTVSNPGGTAKIGELIKGQKVSLGADKWGPKVSIIDYSTKTVDAFGNYTITVRDYAKRVSTSLVVPNSDVDRVVNKLASIRSTPVAWVGDGGYSSLILYGFYKSFDTLIESPGGSTCSLELEGLI